MIPEKQVLFNEYLFILLIKLVLAAFFIACGSDESNKDGTSGSNGSNTSSTVGAGSGSEDTLLECPPEEPPLKDAYCINPACPNRKYLHDLKPANTPKGNCCNTVDIRRYEESLTEGSTYDLEYAIMVNLPNSNPNTMIPAIRDHIRTTQENGGDVTLMRLKDIPRTVDMDKDSDGNPIPVRVTVEVGHAGKLNCDGTYSFYGPKAAQDPVHEGPPHDPSRWQKQIQEVDYYGFTGDYAASIPVIDSIAAVGLRWIPRWMAGSDGEKAQLDYEQPVAFVTQYIENRDKLWGCQGTISSSGNWDTVGNLWAFVPVRESSLVPTAVLDLLSGQKMCGLLALGIGGGNCDEVPQAEWTTKPTVYCDDNWYCWIGDPIDQFYQEFWSIFYEGEDGCDSNGGTRTCCDPAGISTELPPCNAFVSVGAVVQAAVDITDKEVNDPSAASSWAPDCTR